MENKKLIKALKAISNERRFLILKHLSGTKELSVGHISELMDLSFRSVSKHLSVLFNADLVSCRQASLNRYYSINIEGFPKELLLLFKK